MSHESGHIIIESMSAPITASGKYKVWHVVVAVAVAAFGGGAWFF